jgi:hypothetical protein
MVEVLSVELLTFDDLEVEVLLPAKNVEHPVLLVDISCRS